MGSRHDLEIGRYWFGPSQTEFGSAFLQLWSSTPFLITGMLGRSDYPEEKPSGHRSDAERPLSAEPN